MEVARLETAEMERPEVLGRSGVGCSVLSLVDGVGEDAVENLRKPGIRDVMVSLAPAGGSAGFGCSDHMCCMVVQSVFPGHRVQCPTRRQLKMSQSLHGGPCRLVDKNETMV